jgi:hypothetical protein
VLQRALAAVGSGPVIHVVYRSEAHRTLVDLATGSASPVWYDDEEWYDPGVGVRYVERLGGQVIARSVQPATHLERWQQQTYGGIFDGYRDALASGDAQLAGSDRIAGRDVYWIVFTPERLPDVSDGRTHTFGVEIAVDRSTYRPVYLRYLRDGVPEPSTGLQILTLDTVAAGSVDFTPTAPSAPVVSGVIDVRQAPPTAAPLYAGATLAGRGIGMARTVIYTYGDVHAPTHAGGFELCYGSWGDAGGCDGIEVQESADPAAFGSWPSGVVDVPDRSMLVDESGRRALLHLGTLYLHVAAPTADDLTAAARALEEANGSR